MKKNENLQKKHERLLRFPEVRRAVGLSRSTIWRMASRGDFPKPIRIGKTAVAWPSSEVERWISDRVTASRK